MATDGGGDRTAGGGSAEVLETFMRFPAPLALADPGAGLVQVNAAWSARFGPATLMPGCLGGATPGADGRRHLKLRTPGSGAVAEVRAHVTVMPGRAVLVVDSPAGAQREGVLERLRSRVSELERLASTDHLTGAWNRAHFDRTIEAELVRSRAGRLPISLVLLDIDRFKAINDQFGHAVGDAVLRELVSVVHSRIRPSDVVFRWGGEEFAVLASSAGYRGAERLAENLREAVARHSFAGAGTVTVSAGVAEHAPGESPEDWFRRLDGALYSAKATGRNRVVVDRRGSTDAWVAEGPSALHLAWQEAYECGNPAIDGEHRELFNLANRLIDASLRSAEDAQAFLAAFDTLMAHVQRHFAHEEAILDRLHYGDLEPHRRAHQGLLRRAAWLRARATTGEARLGTVVEFLAQDVVARHMMTLDRAFFPLFEARRQAPVVNGWPVAT